VARFIDRLLAYGSSPSTVASLTGSGDLGAIEDAVEAAWRERHGSEPLPPEERRALASWGMTHPPEVGPTFDVGELVGVPVFAADDVARYTGTLAQPLEVADEVATLAPPFDRFWIDVDGAPDPTHTGLRSWGWLVESVDPSEVTDEDREEGEAPPKWVLQMRLFVERTKGRGEGPVASHLIGLAEDGTLYRRPDGEAFWAGRLELRDNSATTPEWTAERISGEGAEYWIHLLFPALLTISFLHCTNVSSVVVAPPEKVSAKHRRRHGLPLVRYTTLDIDPFRQLLTAAGGTDGQGLRAALHVTRGHFKVYGTDAPLFGRLTGSWWWAPHLRGQPSRGVVVKDYRIAAPPTVGRAWQDLSTASPARPTVSQPEDPDRWGAGLVRHNETVNMLAESVRGGGLVPLRAALREPAYDLAFVDGERLVVVEVKSLTEANEERQLRLGLGQVLRWRQLLAGDGHDDVLPVLACSRPPTDPSWITATEQLDGVLIVSPTDWTERLSLQPR
jgi:hypothetical protein